tara:strand:+ start:1100 stop:1669 length:570 start_codon:yes stop_codon:yes gene_type:complete
MKSLHKGGIKILEFTNRGDFALEVFNELEKYCQKNLPDMILGAGSISDETMANMYISSGSNFIVGPLTNKNVAIACNRKKVPYMPGCLTPTEISQAEELGCDVVKVFPADSVSGPNFIKSVLAPMPWSWIMPTGGVDMEEEGLKKWLSSGVFSVGMGSKLFTKEIIQGKNWALLESQCKKLVETINKIK